MEITPRMARMMSRWFMYFEGETIPDSEDYELYVMLLRASGASEEYIAECTHRTEEAKENEQFEQDFNNDPSVRFDHLEYLEHRA